MDYESVRLFGHSTIDELPMGNSFCLICNAPEDTSEAIEMEKRATCVIRFMNYFNYTNFKQDEIQRCEMWVTRFSENSEHWIEEIMKTSIPPIFLYLASLQYFNQNEFIKKSDLNGFSNLLLPNPFIICDFNNNMVEKYGAVQPYVPSQYANILSHLIEIQKTKQITIDIASYGYNRPAKTKMQFQAECKWMKELYDTGKIRLCSDSLSVIEQA